MSECLIQHLNRRVFFDPDTLGIRLPDITGPVQDHHYSEIKAGSDDSHELKNSAVMSTLSINIAQTQLDISFVSSVSGQGCNSIHLQLPAPDYRKVNESTQ